jgi:L-asparaginase II
MAVPYQPVLELTRGRIVESIHYGAIAVVDASTTLLASYGDPQLVTFLRSTAKPFQALPFIERGGDVHFGFAPDEVAIICASHSGTDEHVAVIKRLQAKIGVQESDLLCGVHYPYHEPTAEAMKKRGEQPTPYRHNCSGKHTGMLAHARLRNLPIADYINPKHPVQQAILETFAAMCGLSPGQVELGVDGCSAPNFAVPLYNAALALARLCDPDELSTERAGACKRITAAMTAQPFMVGGPDRFDTLLMQAAGGQVLAKAGAEGYQGLGLMPGVLGERGVGIAIKISDGDLGGRARPAVAVEVLRQLGVLTDKESEALHAHTPQALYNWRKLPVGESRPAFTLERQK